MTTVARFRVRHRLALDVTASLNLVGVLLKYLSLAFLFPVVVALGYGEPLLPFLGAGAATALGGGLLELATSGKERVGTREGFLVVALLWLLAPMAAALPYLFATGDELTRPVDAYFEAMSGFTTTGATTLTDIEALDHSIAMWRQFTQWVGGVGIIVLALAVLPRLRVGGRQLMAFEAPGPEVEPLTTTIRVAARRFLVIYVALSALEVLVLSILGWTGLDERMTPYQALAHALTTMPTGGFSTRARSLEAFGAATQWTVVVFMLLAGTNFALLFRALVRRRPAVFARDDEFRLYVLLVALASVLVGVELASNDVVGGEAAVRHAVFQVISILTTTGYASTDYSLWPVLTLMLLAALMFAGASAGSTAGSIKLVRHVIVGRMLRRELDQTVHPEVVSAVRLNGAVVEERTLRGVIVFAFLYVGLFVAGTIGLMLDAARVDLALSPFEAAVASATTLGDVGPGLGFAGPMGSFEPFSDASKGIMIALMWLGRLEILPVVVLFTRHYWRA